MTDALDKSNIWTALAAKLPAGVISWRQDGKPTQRDGRYFARFVCYIEANTVRERLDSVVPGEWDLTLELLPTLPGADNDVGCAFKARLQVLGVIREDVGHGKDYKQASTDAFKRAAVRFGIGAELYAYEQNWVQVDGDGRYARPLEDPQVAYDRRYSAAAGSARATQSTGGKTTAPAAPVKAEGSPKTQPGDDAGYPEGGTASPTLPDEAPPNPPCPKCGGRMWDNRQTKRNPKAPDFKCRDRSCDGVIWPPRGVPTGNGTGGGAPPAQARQQLAATGEDPADWQEPDGLDASPLGGGHDDIPF